MGLMVILYSRRTVAMANMWAILFVLVYIRFTLGELHGVRLRHDNFDCYSHRPIIEHGHYEVLRKDGHVIRAHCDVGYTMIGSGLRLCQMHEKRFTGEEPRCEDEDECALMVNTTSADEGSAAGVDDEDSSDLPVPCHSTATCINTLGSYRCQCPEGRTGSGFHCEEPATCDQPETPAHAHILQHTLSIIRFYCHPDYSIRGNETLICHDGQWSSKPPRCVAGWKTCGDPGVPENGYRLGNRFYLGSVARFWCRNRYDLKGPRFIVCQEGSESWTSEIPECVERDTPIQGNVEKLEVIRVTDEMTARLIAEEDEQYNMGPAKSLAEDRQYHIGPAKPLAEDEQYNMGPAKRLTEDEQYNMGPAKPLAEDEQYIMGPAKPLAEDEQYNMGPAKPLDNLYTIKDDYKRYDTKKQADFNTEDKNPMMPFAWLAEIHNTTSPYEPALCYGVFICSDWLLTAAKCLQRYQDKFIRLLEPGDITVHVKDEVLKVHKIRRHPRYFIGHHGHDVAVIKVDKPWRRKQESVEILDTKSPEPSLLETWSREVGRVEVKYFNRDQCPQESPYRLSSDTICVQQTVPLGTPLAARWKFPDEPERYFLLAVSKETRGVLMTDIRKHHRWVLTATEGCEL